MNLSKLNPKAQIFAKALVKEFPGFRKSLSVAEGGEFEAFVWSPPGSNAGALVCQSLQGDVWVRFAPGLTGCCCESVPDLLKAVRGIMDGEIAISVVSKGSKWIESFLHPIGHKAKKKSGQTVTTYSWLTKAKRRRRGRSKTSATKAK